MKLFSKSTGFALLLAAGVVIAFSAIPQLAKWRREWEDESIAKANKAA